MNIKSRFLLLAICAGGFSACVKRESTPLSPASDVRVPGSAGGVSVPSSPGTGPQGQASATLTDAAYPSPLSVTDPPVKMRPGGVLTFVVRLTNDSPETWPKFQPTAPALPAVNLAYHWVDPSSGKSLKEGERAFLKEVLSPGGTASLNLMVKAPAESGTYLLRIEPLYETVSWFSSKGGCTLESTVTVAP